MKIPNFLDSLILKLHCDPSNRCCEPVTFFFIENRAVYEVVWKNTVKPDSLQMTVWRMRIAFWIIKVTDTHSEYVILIVLPLQ